MKVYIGRYKNWFGPYQLAELLCFWAKEEKDELGFPKKPDWVHNFGHFLATGSFDSDDTTDIFNKNERTTLLYKFLLWIDSFRKRIEYVKIDRYDTWSMDHTLAPIILPMLIQLKETKHGSPIVDLDDVPHELRFTSHESWEDQMLLPFYEEDDVENEMIHTRWDWVMNEMIFAFQSYSSDWEEKYYSGNQDLKTTPCEWDENGKATMHKLVEGSNHARKFDSEGYFKEAERIQNGLRLFGKYYKGLWD